MLRMICPKCHHHFPVQGCCLKWNDEVNQKKMKKKEKEEEKKEEKEKEEEQEKEKIQEEEEQKEEKMAANTDICSTYYVSSLPMSHSYTNGSNCFINPSTKIHESPIFQSRAINCGSNVKITGSDTLELFYDVQTSPMKQNDHPLLSSPIYQSNDQDPFITVTENLNYTAPSEQYVATTLTGGLTGGSVTITTPDIQSGLIQNTEAQILVQASDIKIQPKLTGGGCLVQKKLSAEDERSTTSKHMKNFAFNNNVHRTFVIPSNSSELPGNIRISGTIRDDQNNEITSVQSKQRKIPSMIKTNDCCDCKNTFQQNCCQNHHRQLFDASLVDNRDSLLLPVDSIGSGVQFQVNATVQLPANLGQCTVNITATTATPPNQVVAMKLPDRGRNNFHGGGLVQPNELDCAVMNQIVARNNKNYNNIEQRNETPITPVPWLSTSWSLDANVNRLREVKRLLHICGWYHEGISWQQSESLLKDASIGRWLMRDSSDSRYTFAISVKTARGPASIRVHYFLEQFRLDAEPKLALAMPFFDCPIKMLEHYVEYSKKMNEHRREVWVDYNGQLYSQIYLTNPLVKEVRSLSHLARLAVNRSKLSIDCLPHLIKNYIKEYPYAL